MELLLLFPLIAAFVVTMSMYSTKQHLGIVDRTINSLKHLDKGNWYDTMQTYQDYPLMRVAESMGKIKAGNQLSFRIGVGSDHDDGHEGLYEDHDHDRPDVMTEGTVPWRNLHKGAAIDTRELDATGAPEHVVDDLEVIRNDMWSSVADDFERGAIVVPSSGNALLPNGLPYYIVWEDSATGKFTTDTNPSGGSIAGIDPTIQTSYANFTMTYVTPTRDDLGRALATAFMQTHWRPPMSVKGDTKITHAIYMTQATKLDWDIAAANQNDQVGPDVLQYHGKSMANRILPTWLPVLDAMAASGSAPVYLVNHAYLFPCFKPGWKFERFGPQPAPKQETTVEFGVNAVYNWSCPLRNRQAVLAISAPFGE